MGFLNDREEEATPGRLDWVWDPRLVYGVLAAVIPPLTLLGFSACLNSWPLPIGAAQWVPWGAYGLPIVFGFACLWRGFGAAAIYLSLMYVPLMIGLLMLMGLALLSGPP